MLGPSGAGHPSSPSLRSGVLARALEPQGSGAPAQVRSGALVGHPLLSKDPSIARALDHALVNHIASGTQSNYKSSAGSYIRFCVHRDQVPFPVDPVMITAKKRVLLVGPLGKKRTIFRISDHCRTIARFLNGFGPVLVRCWNGPVEWSDHLRNPGMVGPFGLAGPFETAGPFPAGTLIIPNG
jgi:hypothetical protein